MVHASTQLMRLRSHDQIDDHRHLGAGGEIASSHSRGEEAALRLLLRSILRVGILGLMLSDPLKSTLKDAAKQLTGHRKRAFMAKVTEAYFEGAARKAETV